MPSNSFAIQVGLSQEDPAMSRKPLSCVCGTGLVSTKFAIALLAMLVAAFTIANMTASALDPIAPMGAGRSMRTVIAGSTVIARRTESP